MTGPHEERGSETAPQAAPRPAPAEDAGERLAYLFRASLHEGRLHPLFHLIQRYRLEKPT